jgi:3-dehydroquinate synthetase
VRLKAAIVSSDEREQGRRAILNAGHTVGHAIERLTGYAILHGDAVAIGLVVEALLAHRLGLAERVSSGSQDGARAPGPAHAARPAWDDAALLDAMAHDKKVRADTLRFALPKRSGRWPARQQLDGTRFEGRRYALCLRRRARRRRCTEVYPPDDP